MPLLTKFEHFSSANKDKACLSPNYEPKLTRVNMSIDSLIQAFKSSPRHGLILMVQNSGTCT